MGIIIFEIEVLGMVPFDRLYATLNATSMFINQGIIDKQPTSHSLVLLEDLSEWLTSSANWLASLKTLGANLLLRVTSSVWVETEKNLSVVEWVLLLDSGALGAGITLGGADDGLDLRGVDETSDIGLGDDGGWEEEVLLEGGWGGGRSVDGIQSLEGRGCPNNETSKVSTWGELEEVQGEDGGSLNTGNVAESKGKLLSINLWVVDDQWATTLAVTAATELTLSGAELAGSLDLGDIGTSTNGVEESDGSGSAGNGGTGENLRVDDQWDLWDGRDLVSAGHQERWDGRSSQGRGSSETLLSKVDLLVPLAPDLSWGEHATGTAHVTEGSLSSTVSSTTGDTWNTGNSATCRG